MKISQTFSSSSILSLPHQASPVSRTPSLPAVDTSYINTSLIQDYRHPFHMTPMPYDLQGESPVLLCRHIALWMPLIYIVFFWASIRKVERLGKEGVGSRKLGEIYTVVINKYRLSSLFVASVLLPVFYYQW